MAEKFQYFPIEINYTNFFLDWQKFNSRLA
jgi:hypothetical protein